MSIHSDRLRDLLTSRSATAVVQTLLKIGAIEENPSYSAGRFTKSYRLTPCFRDASIVFRPFTDACLASKLAAYDETCTKEAIGESEPRQAVWEGLRAVTVQPDALALANAFPFTSSMQRGAWFLTLRDFNQARFWFRAHEATGRVYHNVTSCARELRPFLRIAGEPVAEVDIGAAQPFFALALFPPDHPECERRAYVELVTSDDFYASLFTRIPKPLRSAWGSELAAWETPGSTHRDRFKKHTLQHVFYGETPKNEHPAVFGALGSVSPWLAGELARRRAIKDGPSALALEMQSVEAGLILGRVIPRIRRELPGCHAVSVHDGILCPVRRAWTVKRLVEEEAERMFGVRPRVRVKGNHPGDF